MLHKEPTDLAHFTCSGFGKETYPGFCSRSSGAVGGWFDDLLGSASKTASSSIEQAVIQAAKEEVKLTLWKIAAFGVWTVLATRWLYR